MLRQKCPCNLYIFIAGPWQHFDKTNYQKEHTHMLLMKIFAKKKKYLKLSQKSPVNGCFYVFGTS